MTARSTHAMAVIVRDQLLRDLLAEIAEWQRESGPDRDRARRHALELFAQFRTQNRRCTELHAAWMREERGFTTAAGNCGGDRGAGGEGGVMAFAIRNLGVLAINAADHDAIRFARLAPGGEVTLVAGA